MSEQSHQSIWKYEIVGVDAVEMPRSSIILGVYMQRGYPVLYAKVDPRYAEVRRRIIQVWTGEDIGIAALAEYVGTYELQNGLVYHVFDGGEIAP